jgi:hypothetical protein
MKVVLRYTRLPKPRGGWNYSLHVVLRVEYSDAERAAMNPDWKLKAMSWPVIFWETSHRGAVQEYMISYAPSHATSIEREFHVQTSDDREILVRWFIARRDELVEAGRNFWEDNPPVPGEQEHVMDVTLRDGEVVPEAAEPKVRRRVTAMAGVAS